MDALTSSHLRVAAILLVGGWVTFWAGAFTPPWRWWYPIPVREYLELVEAHRFAWLWIAASFVVGVLLTLAGLVTLGTVLRAAGDRIWSQLGQVAFLAGSLLWLTTIAFRATATVSAARETVASGNVPAWFEPLRTWSVALFALYMVLAYLAIAAYGKAMLDTNLVPPWLAWTHIIFGSAGVAGYVLRIPLFDPPLMIHLVPGILGVVLLFGSRGG